MGLSFRADSLDSFRMRAKRTLARVSRARHGGDPSEPTSLASEQHTSVAAGNSVDGNSLPPVAIGVEQRLNPRLVHHRYRAINILSKLSIWKKRGDASHGDPVHRAGKPGLPDKPERHARRRAAMSVRPNHQDEVLATLREVFDRVANARFPIVRGARPCRS